MAHEEACAAEDKREGFFRQGDARSPGLSIISLTFVYSIYDRVEDIARCEILYLLIFYFINRRVQERILMGHQ